MELRFNPKRIPTTRQSPTSSWMSERIIYVKEIPIENWDEEYEEWEQLCSKYEGQLAELAEENSDKAEHMKTGQSDA